MLEILLKILNYIQKNTKVFKKELILKQEKKYSTVLRKILYKIKTRKRKYIVNKLKTFYKLKYSYRKIKIYLIFTLKNRLKKLNKIYHGIKYHINN